LDSGQADEEKKEVVAALLLQNQIGKVSDCEEKLKGFRNGLKYKKRRKSLSLRGIIIWLRLWKLHQN